MCTPQNATYYSVLPKDFTPTSGVTGGVQGGGHSAPWWHLLGWPSNRNRLARIRRRGKKEGKKAKEEREKGKEEREEGKEGEIKGGES